MYCRMFRKVEKPIAGCFPEFYYLIDFTRSIPPPLFLQLLLRYKEGRAQEYCFGNSSCRLGFSKSLSILLYI